MADNSEPGSLLGKIAAYTELLHKDPCSTIFVPLSEAYRQMDMLEDAVEIARNGIVQNPAFPSGYVAYGRSLAQQGLIEEATAEFEKALILDKKNLAALKSLAKIHIQQGRRDEALKLLDRASTINPDDAAVSKMQSKLKRQMDATVSSIVSEAEVASISKSESAEKSGEPISTATIAEIYIRQGFPEKALKVYRDLLRAEPQNDQLRQKLVDLKEQLSDEGAEADSGLTVSQPTSFSSEKSSSSPVAESVSIEIEISEKPDRSSLVEIFVDWLDSIKRRKEAHVQ